MKKHVIALVIVLVLSFWSVKPLVLPGYFPMHDDTQVGRVVAMARSLAEGQFPVRWVADLGYGYGYPIFNFYGPLPYYFGGILAAFGFDSLTSTKTMMAVGMLAASVTMYLLAAAVFGMGAGIVAAILYQYAPYHAVQLYVRGAVGELWAYGLLPLVGWGLVLIAQKRYTSGILAGAVALALVIVSHTIMGYLTFGFLILGLGGYWLRQFFQKKLIKRWLVSHLLLVILGLGLSAFFWLPAALEMRFTNVAAQVGGGADWRDHFVCLPQLWNSIWGFGGSIPGCVDGFSFKLGKLQLLLSAAATILWFRRKASLAKFTAGTALAVVLVALFLTNAVSSFLWRLPFMDFVQYPWRLLAPAAFGLSLLSASLIAYTPTALQSPLVTILLIATLFFNAKLFVPQYIFSRESPAFETTEELRWRVSKISDEYLPPDLLKPPDASGIVRETILDQPGLRWKTQGETATHGRYTLSAQKELEVTIQRAFFPGWQFKLDGQPVVPKIVSGLSRLKLPAGEHVLDLSFGSTPVRLAGNLISLISLAVFIWYGKQRQNTHA